MNTDRRNTDLILHRSLDTFGLTPEEFRLYAHLAATIQSPAADPAIACRMPVQATELALAVLSGCGLVTLVEGVWVLNDSQDWVGGMVDQVREAAKAELAAKLEAAVVPEPEHPHQQFMRRWDEEFMVVNEYKYTFDGPRDGKAVKTLLAQGKTVEGMIELAKSAWIKARTGNQRCWACSQAVTIWGFVQRLNAIQMELKQGCTGSAPPSAVGSKVYGEKVAIKTL